jgi:broad specificity phosphatase PhoE
MPRPNISIPCQLQGEANSSATYDYSVHDPPLTALGVSQARAVAQRNPSLLTSSALLVSSPLRRTLQTALLAFHRNPLPHPGFQENSSKPCDTGSPAAQLNKEFPELDFTLVVDGWDSKEGEWAPDEPSLAQRAAKMRKWLKDREENEIIVITHGGNLTFTVLV